MRSTRTEKLCFTLTELLKEIFIGAKFDKNSNSFERKIGTGELNCGGEFMHGTDSLFVRTTQSGSPLQVLF